MRAEGNAGNQVKTAGPVLIENSILLGNCAFFDYVPDLEPRPRATTAAPWATPLSVSHIGNSTATSATTRWPARATAC